jgi:small-conductance mechanosensitive channel
MCLFVAGGASLSQAQKTSPPQESEKSLDTIRKEIEAVHKNLRQPSDDAKLLRHRAMALGLQSKARAIADTLTPILTAVQARLTELGPAAANKKETPNIATQRANLERSRATLDTQIRLARELSIQGAQTAEQISAIRRSQFNAHLSERRPSLLGPYFWSEFRDDIPGDLHRLDRLSDELIRAITQPPLWLWASLILGIAIVVGLWLKVQQGLLQLTTARIPPGRLRRALHALVLILLATLAPGMITQLVAIGLDWQQQLSENARALVGGLTGIVCFGGFITSLGLALLSPSRPSWRLFQISDRIVQQLRGFPLSLGIATVLVWFFDHVPVALNASLTTTIAMNSLATVLLIATLASGLKQLHHAQQPILPLADSAALPPTPLWAVVSMNIAWIVLGAALASVFIGYVAFGNFVAKQIVWTLVVLCASYLLCVLVDDFFITILGSSKEDTELSSHPTSRLRDQMAILLSGVTRLFIVIFALMLLLSKFGDTPLELLQTSDRLRNGLMIGSVQLQPTALIQGALVLVIGLYAIRLLKGWLTKRYLPTTALDLGMRLSTTTLFGYVGIVIVAALALGALGIGLDRLAWVASALSVGIGFGLQAVVQNFVSGLILLVERPVKVGDWVSVNNAEGDILRINVRATEIQMGDRSTVIVPNSEFITKVVRNVTHANPLGLVQIKLPLPLSIDADRAKNLIHEALVAQGSLLSDPAPNVFLDGIDNGALLFNAVGYVASPRQSYSTRSALLFDILKHLADAGIRLGKPPTLLVSATPDPCPPEETKSQKT